MPLLFQIIEIDIKFVHLCADEVPPKERQEELKSMAFENEGKPMSKSETEHLINYIGLLFINN